jgi:hypothetical protein
MSSIPPNPPDTGQPHPLNYERVQAGPRSSPTLLIVIFVLAAAVLLALINWLAFAQRPRGIKMRTVVSSSPPVQTITTQPTRP